MVLIIMTLNMITLPACLHVDALIRMLAVDRKALNPLTLMII
jgi:hypothetical protein